MKSLKCPNCAGPIELADDEVRTACPYCGGALERTTTLPRGIEVAGPALRIDVRRGARTVRRMVGCTLAVVAGIAAIGAFVAWRAVRVGGEVARSVADAAVPRRGADGPLPLERLADASFSGRHRLAAAPPPGGLAAFEPVAGLPWALALAQRWSPDVQLWRIDVERLRPDGTVDLVDDAHAKVSYRFVSPRRIAAFRERANVEPDARGEFELWIAIEEGAIYAQEISALAQVAKIHYEEFDRLDFPRSVPLPELLAGPARRRGLPAVPFFNGYLIRLENEGWCWYLSTLSGEPGIPRFRARDGRMWPY